MRVEVSYVVFPGGYKMSAFKTLKSAHRLALKLIQNPSVWSITIYTDCEDDFGGIVWEFDKRNTTTKEIWK